MNSIRTSVKRGFVLLGCGAILALYGPKAASAAIIIDPPIDVIGNLSFSDFNGNGYGTNAAKPRPKRKGEK